MTRTVYKVISQEYVHLKLRQLPAGGGWAESGSCTSKGLKSDNDVLVQLQALTEAVGSVVQISPKLLESRAVPAVGVCRQRGSRTWASTSQSSARALKRSKST